MSTANPDPLSSPFRMPLYPTLDRLYFGNTGTRFIRFSVLVGLRIRETSLGPQPWPVARAIMAPESPYSVLPFDVRMGLDLEITEPPESLRPDPIPSWRGVPCSFGLVTLWFRNDLVPDHQLVCFEVPMLLPHSAPTATHQLYLSDEQNMLFGSDFFVREQFQVLLQFDQFYQIDHLITGASVLDSMTPCGYVERDA